MAEHEFTIVASGLDPDGEDFADRFFEAGCDDATISFQRGCILLDFNREAPTFFLAVGSAVESVLQAGAKPVRVEPDNLVSLAEVAARAGLTRAAVSHYASGARGEGFPAPVARVTTESPLWDWADVAGWLHGRGRLDLDEALRARVLRDANAAVAKLRLERLAEAEQGREGQSGEAAA